MRRGPSGIDDQLFWLLEYQPGSTIAELAEAACEDRMEVFLELLSLEEEGFVFRKKRGNVISLLLQSILVGLAIKRRRLRRKTPHPRVGGHETKATGRSKD